MDGVICGSGIHRLRAGLDLILDQRGVDTVAVPGGASGLLCRDYKGKEADVPVVRIDPGVVAVVADLRAQERQAAEELGQWKTGVEEPRSSPRRRQLSWP
jgi:hypothetical protein